MNKKKKHVVPYHGRWAVKTEGERRPKRVFWNKQDAIDCANDLARNEGTRVIVHGARGQVIQEVRLKGEFSDARIRASLRSVSAENASLRKAGLTLYPRRSLPSRPRRSYKPGWLRTLRDADFLAPPSDETGE